MICKKLIVLYFLMIVSLAFNQRNVKDSVIATPWIIVHYGANLPQNDLVKQFGFLNHLGIHAGYKTTKNWTFTLDGNFIFGEKVKNTTIFDNLKDDNGNLTDVVGDVATVLTFARGFNANLSVGKVFPLRNTNKNSGIYIHTGVGYLAHKIRVESRDQVIPLLELEYKKGYDRLRTGLNFHQFFGYAHLGNSGILNFYSGIYFQQGFTSNQREIFFDEPELVVPTKTYLDVQLGLKLGWFIPIYKRKPKDYYFN